MVSDKKLVQEVTGWLKVFDDGSVDRTWTGPPEARFMTEPVPPHHEFKNGVATSDVIIDPTSGLTVRIYLPEKKPGDEDKLPVLLHFHGGGFCVSQADWYIYYHTHTVLAIRARVICVSVYLRRAPENRLPAACEDGYSALLWLQCVAKGQSEQPWLHSHADFTRVFLIGDSSGGNLVHQVAAVGGKMQLGPLRLAGGVMIHPGFVRSERSKSELQQEDSPFLTLEMADKFLKLALPRVKLQQFEGVEMEFSGEMNIYRESELSGDFEGEISKKRIRRALADPKPIFPADNSTYSPRTGGIVESMSLIICEDRFHVLKFNPFPLGLYSYKTQIGNRITS
ncbi:hypothetical protein VitviT2T_012018 [Vitis vinifera]|uniref:Alpha/beta hydrolase fold-3 domain-containing protein n=1 Tax=Vitis vinifera TaxID=29760 RepID=A0ABY9CDX9_VITVI|nr:hypothetical protein VitviT2T_012018 [Vitis vinifera]